MKWRAVQFDETQAAALAVEISCSPVLARLLVARGITEARAAQEFLHPALSQLHPPLLMAGMAAAVERLEAALDRKEKILIYGDYDVDGTTAIVILKTAIELCGGTADFHVPHRIREGYGMRDEVIERAAAEGVRLIISVDTGIRAFAAAETAKRSGLDLIVTDHHLPGDEGLPYALAVVNPNRPGCEYPCKALCGAGVAFKLAQGLMQRRLDSKDQSRLLLSFMKIVAIATIADSVPLTGENRVFAKLGLEGLRSPVNVGLKALLEVAQLTGARPPTTAEIAFRVAPRLNAAGRMDVARDVVELFSVKDPVRAREIAQRLDVLNAERQQEERRIMEEIEQRIAGDAALTDAYCMVLDGDGWHRGVIGITASRVVERHGRPALVISRDGDQAHGSGRSIPAFHLLDALDSCRELFTRHGGHAHAVGFSLPIARVPELRSRLDQYARERLMLSDFEPALRFDAELPLAQVTPAFYEQVRWMEPFGMGNSQPVFAARGVKLVGPPRLIKEKHIKLRLAAAETPATNGHSSAGRAVSFNAMGWRMAEPAKAQKLLAGDSLDVAYTIEFNDHPDFGGLELSLRDFKAPEAKAELAKIPESPVTAPFPSE